MNRTDFDNFVRRISRKLYGIAYRILNDQEGSEDAVQEVLLKLWKMNVKLSEYVSVDALAVTMIKNHCFDIFRKQKHSRPAEEDALLLIPGNDSSPHEKMEQNESYRVLHRIINDLPEIYREIICLRELDGLDYEEIAKQSGQNINSLRVNLSRARKIVRDKYNKYYNER